MKEDQKNRGHVSLVLGFWETEEKIRECWRRSTKEEGKDVTVAQ